MKHILSLGAGVQSSTVFLMSCHGVLPKLDAAIFADTQWEPLAVYSHLTLLYAEGRRYGIPIYTVTAGNIRNDAVRSKVRGVKAEGTRWASMPFYTQLTDRDGEGMIRRQCTNEYKIQPVQQKLKELACGERVTLWYGISGDEMRRMRTSKVRWIENYYPLIFGLNRPYHRHDCLLWLSAHDYDDVPRSACIGCPYHSNMEWREMQRERPNEFADAVDFDASIRSVGGQTADTYLHRSCKPLPMIDFDSKEDKGQQNWLNECEGMCGV